VCKHPTISPVTNEVFRYFNSGKEEVESKEVRRRSGEVKKKKVVSNF
jgi:hypothetical protein